MKTTKRTISEIKSGDIFERLKVLGRLSNNEQGQAYFACRCECGTLTSVRGNHLLAGQRSCGCVLFEKRPSKTKRRADFPEYWAWLAMKQRCGNPRNPMYRLYGQRGITVCRRWRESFEAFFNDIGARPSPAHSIDRIDNNGDYEPSNCRWATPEEQANNVRRNRCIEFRGETKTIAEWARIMNIHYNTLTARIKKGLPVELALTRPAKLLGRAKGFRGANL